MGAVEPRGSAGYSGTPLARKLGIKPETTVVLIAAPEAVEELLEPLPGGVELRRGMVDSKVCAIDETWSGLRLTQRRTK